MDNQRLDLLLHRHFDQLLEPGERAELELMLLNDAAARERFWEMARCNALIRFWGETECGRQEAQNLEPQPLPASPSGYREPMLLKLRRLRRWLIPVSAVAFGVIVALAGFRFMFARFSSASDLAVVTRVYHAKWAAGAGNFQPGQTLKRGWLRLEEGAVQIEFSRGARVVLQGPAELQLVSKNEAFLRSGKLNAAVPVPAHGFRITTPEFSVVDLGTKFGCIVGTNAQAEVHVFVGAVSWKPGGKGTSGRQLTANQALKISGQQAQSIPSDQSRFLSEDELTRLAWREASSWLQSNPDGLVYLDFENANGQTPAVHNRAENAPNKSEVNVSGCNFVAGRFPGKTGVQFNTVKDRLRLTVPGNHDTLTFLAWVRIDALPLTQASLAMTESFALGEVHWYVHYDGSFGLAVHTKLPNSPSGWEFVQTRPGVISTNLGSWIMLASVFDRTTGKATDYLNGQPVATGEIVTAHTPLHLDTFEIGNWGVSPKDPRMATPRHGRPGDMIRNLSGCMDEFAILATPLKPEDIQRLYHEGCPIK